MILRMFAWVAFSVAVMLSAADAPKMFATRIEIAERGDVPGYLFVMGTNKYTFMTPPGWKPEGKIDRREVIFISADLDSSLTLKITDVQQRSPEETRASVQQQFPDARMVHEFTCHAAGRPGSGFEFEQTAAEKARVKIRYGLVPLPGGSAVFTLRAPADQMRDLDLVFGRFLASFQVEGPRPRR